MKRSGLVKIIPWRDDFLSFFRLVGTDWTSPQTLRSTANPTRDRLTLAGVWTQPDGVEVKLTSRCKLEEDGFWYVIEEKLDIRLFGPVGVSA